MSYKFRIRPSTRRTLFAWLWGVLYKGCKSSPTSPFPSVVNPEIDIGRTWCTVGMRQPFGWRIMLKGTLYVQWEWRARFPVKQSASPSWILPVILHLVRAFVQSILGWFEFDCAKCTFGNARHPCGWWPTQDVPFSLSVFLMFLSFLCEISNGSQMTKPFEQRPLLAYNVV